MYPRHYTESVTCSTLKWKRHFYSLPLQHQSKRTQAKSKARPRLPSTIIQSEKIFRVNHNRNIFLHYVVLPHTHHTVSVKYYRSILGSFYSLSFTNFLVGQLNSVLRSWLHEYCEQFLINLFLSVSQKKYFRHSDEGCDYHHSEYAKLL